jgi:hypothetical protein
MDRLNELLETARPLLRRVDETLTIAGAPADHSVWGELRRVRLLPGDAARAVAALRPADLVEAAPELRADARACVTLADGLPPPDDWTGDAADAYDEVRRRMAAQLSGGDESLDERLEATADLAEALREWMEQARTDLSVTLADILNSSEAMTLARPAAAPQPTPQETEAAADIAAHLLHTVANTYDYATDLIHGSAPLTTPMPM